MHVVGLESGCLPGVSHGHGGPGQVHFALQVHLGVDQLCYLPQARELVHLVLKHLECEQELVDVFVEGQHIVVAPDRCLFGLGVFS